MWYRTRHTFHTAGGESVNWVQWRNEVFFWFVYDSLSITVKFLAKTNLKFLGSRNATFNARYRFRPIGVYSIRRHFHIIYDDEEEGVHFPETDFATCSWT